MRNFLLTTFALLGLYIAVSAEETEHTGVRITFLPPPMDGTISLGVYSQDGKLVRTLKTEAEAKDFVIGLNGLITRWDGKNDAGEAAKPGSYNVRGFSVGSLEVEGVAYYGNDWITNDESPRITRVLGAGRFLGPGRVEIPVEVIGGKAGRVTVTVGEDPAGAAAVAFLAESELPEDSTAEVHFSLPTGAENSVRSGDTTFAFGPGKVWKRSGAEWLAMPFSDLEKPVGVASGGETVWVIDAKSSGTAVCEFSATGELLRALPTAEGDAAPRWIAARGRDELLLVDQTPELQRVRLLRREQNVIEDGEKPISTWRTVVSKTIRSAPSLEAITPHVPRLERFKVESKLVVRLVPNPLVKDAATNVTVEIGKDEKGALLRTSDGLPLIRLTETPGLNWAVMGKEAGSKAVTILQADGSVVEEFRAGKLANMMAFDAGVYEWDGK
jgi:hypothetical protein